MKLSEANDIALALLLGVAAFWLVNFCLRLAGHRLYWLTFWALVIGLPGSGHSLVLDTLVNGARG